MKNAGEFIGKTVLSLSGERLGEINNLTFDRYFKRLKNISVFDDEQEEFLLPVNGVYCHGENAVIMRIRLKNAAQDTFVSPLTVKAYDLKGKYLGIVTDMFFESDGKTVKSLTLDDGNEISQKNIASHGKDAVFFDFSEKPKRFGGIKKLPNPENSLKEPPGDNETAAGTINTGPYAQIKPAGAAAQAKPAEAAQAKPAKDVQTKPEEFIDRAEKTQGEVSESDGSLSAQADEPKKPDNLVVGAKLLIGRRLKKNIYLRNGSLLIKEGTVITLDTVNLALKHGKLFELTVNSLGNL